MRTYLLIIAALILAFCACKKQPTKYAVNGSLKAAFSYKVGTYWVYKDSISGGWDSFYVTRSDDTWNVNDGYSIEDVEINISEQNITPGTVSKVRDWAFDYAGNGFSIAVSESKIYTHSIQYSALFLYPFGTTSIGVPETSAGGGYIAGTYAT